MPSGSSRAIRAGRANVEIGTDNSMLIRGLRNAKNHLKTFSTSVSTLGAKMLGVSTMAGLPMLAALKYGARFEQSMARVKALLNADAAVMKSLTDEAKKLGMSTVFSAAQAADAMGEFAKSGFSAAEILKAIGPTLSLAAAGQIEIAQAAGIAAKTMRSMGIAADDVGRAIDVITAATSKSNMTMEQFDEAIAYVGPLAKTLSVPLEEAAAAIGTLSDAGIQASMAGTSFRAFLVRLAGPTAEAQAALSKLGVSTRNAAGNLRPIAAILEDLGDGLAGMGNADQMAALTDIFGQRQAAGASILIRNITALKEKTAALFASQGFASRVAKDQTNTLTGATLALGSAIGAVAENFRDALAPPLRVFLEHARLAAVATAEWVAANKGIVATGAAVVGAIGGMGTVLMGVGGLAALASVAIGGLSSILAGFGGIVAAALTPMGALTIAAGGIAYQFVRMSGVVGAAVDWLKSRFQTLSKYSSQVIETMRAKIEGGEIKAAANVLFAGLSFVWEAGIAKLGEAWDTLLYSISDALLRSGGWLQSTWIKICAGLAEAWTALSMTMRTTHADTTNWVAKKWLEVQGRIDGLDSDQIAQGQKMLDEDNEERKTQIEQETGKEMAKIEADRKAQLDEARENLDKMRDMLSDDLAGRQEAAEKKLRDAERALQKAIADAKSDVASDAADEKAKKNTLANSISKALALAGDKQKAIGMFNTSAIWGMVGGGSDTKKIAAATQAQLQISRKIEKNTAGIAFT